MQSRLLQPIATFDEIDIEDANRMLGKWGHKMGPINRPMGFSIAHAMKHEGNPVAVTVTSDLIRENVAQRQDLTRDNTCELSRVCAARRDLCRVVLRLWREFVFPTLGYQYAISYQDAVLHSGDLYRFDGWTCIVERAHSGVDARSGRVGRTKKVWLWTAKPCERPE